jgi:hypothetical protein
MKFWGLDFIYPDTDGKKLPYIVAINISANKGFFMKFFQGKFKVIDLGSFISLDTKRAEI